MDLRHGDVTGSGIGPDDFCPQTGHRLAKQSATAADVQNAQAFEGTQLVRVAAMLGGNLRVGLEDSLFIGKGELATSNAQQVSRIRGIVENLGLTVATPEEARERLALKGGDRVNF